MFDAVILAGGLGTRLRSVVSDVPKCMAPVAGKPFLAWIFDWLKKYKADNVILSLGYLNEVVIDWYARSCKDYPIPVKWVIEDTPLGTGGGIRLALTKATSRRVIVLNGDTFFDANLDGLCLFNERLGTPLSVALKPMKDFERYGSVTLEGDKITSFNEKQYCKSGLINGGTYCIDRASGLLDSMPERFSFEKDVLEPQSVAGNLSGFVSDGSFIDIGIPEDYNLAQTFLPENL